MSGTPLVLPIVHQPLPLVVLLLLGMLQVPNALAAQGGRYADYLAAAQANSATATAYMRGVADAVATVNASIEHIEKREPSFCPPPMLRLSDSDNDRLMREFMSRHSNLDPRQVSVSSVLFLAYKERFPCKR